MNMENMEIEQYWESSQNLPFGNFCDFRHLICNRSGIPKDRPNIYWILIEHYQSFINPNSAIAFPNSRCNEMDEILILEPFV